MICFHYTNELYPFISPLTHARGTVYALHYVTHVRGMVFYGMIWYGPVSRGQALGRSSSRGLSADIVPAAEVRRRR